MTAQPYTVVVAGEGDLADVARMRARWTLGEPAPGGSEPADPAYPERLADWWRREAVQRVLWLARHRQSGEAAGMVNALIFERMPRPGQAPSRWAYVANLWVEPEHRRGGVGTALVGALVEWARTSGMVRVVLSPSEMSVPLYASFGFRSAADLMRLDLR